MRGAWGFPSARRLALMLGRLEISVPWGSHLAARLDFRVQRTHITQGSCEKCRVCVAMLAWSVETPNPVLILVSVPQGVKCLAIPRDWKTVSLLPKAPALHKQQPHEQSSQPHLYSIEVFQFRPAKHAKKREIGISL
jgi:hypothetical protein